MKNIFITIIAALFLLVSCSEWEPVTTLRYKTPEMQVPVMPDANAKIKDVKALYVKAGTPVLIENDYVIKGQVISSDQVGNIYRSIYIQDDTGAIELKIGKSGLYNDYKIGQWVAVKCEGLTIGEYEGMLQFGFSDPSGTYETAYIDVQLFIDLHIFRGAVDTPVAPVVVSEAELSAALSSDSKNPLFGKYITLKGLTYGAVSSFSTDKYKRIFCLLYIDPNKDKKDPANRVFLSRETYGVKTWAMSKSNFLNHLEKGDFDTPEPGKPLSAEVKTNLKKYATSVTVSQYFSLGNTPVQIRTSGYCKFADKEIDSAVIGDPTSSSADGKSIDVTGILTVYRGAAQFTLIDIEGVKVNN